MLQTVCDPRTIHEPLPTLPVLRMWVLRTLLTSDNSWGVGKGVE